MKVYLDHGATTPVDPKVVEAMLPYYTETYGNASSLHQFGREAKEALERSRDTIAKSINADPAEIIFTSGGSESDNLAIKGIVPAKKGSHIITSAIEHPAVLNTCQTLEKNGCRVTYLGVDAEGFVNPDDVAEAISRNTALVTVMHANNEIGTIEPIREIGKICGEHDVPFHTDAVQSYTKVPIDVKKDFLDMMSVSAHKIHGPKGIGAMYVKEGTRPSKQIEGGHHEHDLRAGTENIPGIVGFAKAAEIARGRHVDYMTGLRDHLIRGVIGGLSDVKLNGPKKLRLCNNANVSIRYVEGESMLLHMDIKGVALSTGSACSSQSLEPSHVLTAIGLRRDVAHGSLRMTLGRENTRDEIDYTVESLKEIVESLRKISPLGRR
ncbi:MAG: cysteine desulfurase family protein [archaeon]